MFASDHAALKTRILKIILMQVMALEVVQKRLCMKEYERTNICSGVPTMKNTELLARLFPHKGLRVWAINVHCYAIYARYAKTYAK